MPSVSNKKNHLDLLQANSSVTNVHLGEGEGEREKVRRIKRGEQKAHSDLVLS